jgi:uncharacterized Zn finger protein
MPIPLTEFELFVNEVTLLHGLTYYKKGVVGPLQVLQEGHLQTVVTGTNKYQVDLRFDDGKILEHSCTCDYVLGPICKHVAAVLIRLQRDHKELVWIQRTAN